MEKQIVIKNRVAKMNFKDVDEATKVAKDNTSKVKKTKAGINIRRLKDLLILF